MIRADKNVDGADKNRKRNGAAQIFMGKAAEMQGLL
jgi:hypothetical protein